MKKILFSYAIPILMLLLSGNQALAQEKWTVDDDAMALQNPLALSGTVVETGASSYQKNCVSCHGPAGEGKPLPLQPTPPDLGDEAYITTATDGEIFTKITQGRGAMPTFEKVLSETERWSVVAYLRSFGDSEVKVDQSATAMPIAGELSLKLNLNDEKQFIEAGLIAENAAGEQLPAGGVKLSFWAKRTFGNLLLGEVKTNANGIAGLSFPQDLPRNRKNETEILVQVADAKIYGDVSMETKVEWGKANPHKNLLAGRSMWTVRAMAPLWLIITYHLALIGVLVTVGYVVFQILKLPKA